MKMTFICLLSIVLIGLSTAPGLLQCGQSSESESVKVIFVQVEQPNGRLTSKGLEGLDLTHEEIASLASQDVSGVLNVVGYALHGSRDNTKPRRIVIVMQRQIEKAVELRQPSNSDLIYLQSDHDWKMLPAGAPTSDRLIRLEVNKEYRNQTMYWFQLPDGSMQGKTAFIW
jgi:hypothetical protein